MLSKFFIDRPVLSWVIALLTVILGLIVLPSLKLSRFPDIAPPTISISLSYPGASAETLENSVAQVVEQQMTGLDNLLYFNTTVNSEGNVNVRFSFDQSVNPDVAQMQVQNRFDMAMSKLPDEVQQNGVRIRKVSEDVLQNIAFYTKDGSLTQEDIGGFIVSVLQDPISRLNGVGDVNVRGSQYAMRIWLDQDKLHFYSLTPQDVVNAIEAQNKQISVGQVGAMPAVPGQQLNVVVKSRHMLETPEEFENILLKSDEIGGTVYIKDVAKVEKGRASYTVFANYNHLPMASLEINLTEGANAVETANRIVAELERLRPLFPESLEYVIPYDTVPFVKASLYEVGKTLVEALILVSLVILLFLRDIRSTLVVTITIPIVLCATVVVLYFFGYSINTLTMFAMVLAIGLLVDDAIVVVENVNRLIYKFALTPYEAAVRSMQEISSALFGVGLVIAAVFVPMSFFGGAAGNIYRQFSVTIVSAMLMSIVTALVVTPSLCASILKVRHRNPHKRAKKGILSLFDTAFSRLTSAYTKSVNLVLHYKKTVMLLLAFLSVACVGLFSIIPSSFLPIDDQGIMSVKITLPTGSTNEMTEKVGYMVEDYFLTKESKYVEGIMLTLGHGSGGAFGQSTATANVKLVPWEQREEDEGSAQAILARAKAYFDTIPDAKITVSLPSSIRGMGGSSGFQVNVQNLMGNSHEQFMQDIDDIIDIANADPMLYNVRTNVLDDSKQLEVVLDDRLIKLYHLDSDNVNSNLSIAWGGKYVNDFIDRGRIKKVYVQSMPQFRSMPEDLSRLYFKNDEGKMVGFDSIGSYKWTFGPQQLNRFNGTSSIFIEGDSASGVSSGQAMDAIAKVISSHPGQYSYAWSGASYQEQLTGSHTQFLFAISALIVFLCLAALYESWSIPFAVIMIIPVGAFGALGLVWLRGIENDIYLQVGLLTTGGLAAKNAILIVEYAHQFRMRGQTLLKSAKQAAALRFRPIIMTSAAFLLGVMPLLAADGAGASSQQSIGTGVVGGTLSATVLGVLMVPVFFVCVSLLFDEKLRKRAFKWKR